MPDFAAIDAIVDKLRESTHGYRALDADVLITLGKWPERRWQSYDYSKASGYEVTTDIHQARRLIKDLFPGWLYRICECSVSDDAWLVPDFNDPIHGADFQRRFPGALAPQVDIVDWFGTDVDLRPSGRPAIAMCISMLLARRKVMEVAAGGN